jgi:hypothetical protein
MEDASAADISCRPTATSRTNGNPQSKQKRSPSHQAVAGRRAPRGRIVGARMRAPTPNRSAMMSQIRNSWVTLKRVITNQPEKITKENVAQMNPIGRRLSKAAVPSTTNVAIGAVKQLIIVHEGLKRSQRVENRVWPEALPVIDFDVSESDPAVRGDYIGRGYRQLPTLVAVDPRQCLVIRSQGGAQLLR